MRQRVDMWAFILAMAVVYALAWVMLLSAIGLTTWRVDVLAIWQLGFWALALASAMDGWLARKKEAKLDGNP